VPEVLLQGVYVLNWHMLEDLGTDTPGITAALLAVNVVAKCCLR
jgi:hypothetical protein